MDCQAVLLREHTWPTLSLAQWQDTYSTLHMWAQIVGKIRTKLTPPINHWWHSTLYVTPQGLTTSLIPYNQESFEIRFDFLGHRLEILTSWSEPAKLALVPQSVADFYSQLMQTLRSLGIDVRIYPVPQEVTEPIRFDQDRVHASYDGQAARRLWRILLESHKVFSEFRGHFIGKCSPVHFFWGSFDLAVSRFSGRPAPQRPGADPVTKEAYSHEVCSAGFWPGGGKMDAPAYYCYITPEPPGFAQAKVRPQQAFYSEDFHEFLLRYDDVRESASPKDTLLEFLQSTYDAAASLAAWDRVSLERQISGEPGKAAA